MKNVAANVTTALNKVNKNANKEQDKFFAKDHRLRCLDMAIKWSETTGNNTLEYCNRNEIIKLAEQFANFVETGKIPKVRKEKR